MTLSEIIVVVAILGLLILLAVLSLNPRLQLSRARDSRRKSDLKRVATALEDYAGDQPCYPTVIYETVGGQEKCFPDSGFKNYLSHPPCDPLTKLPYPYVRVSCKEFVIYATLELEQEKNYDRGNFIVTSPNMKGIPEVSPTEAPAPTSPPPSATPPPHTSYFGCFAGECKEISGMDECSPNYGNSSDCSGDDCCTYSGDYKCAGGQNECLPRQ